MIKAGIDCYMSQGTADALKVDGHRVNIIRSREQFKLGTWQVLPFSVPHDVDNLGFLLANEKGERCLFAVDCVYIPYRFKNLKIIMVGINYSMDILRENINDGSVDRQLKRRIIQSHMSLETLGAFLAANNLSKVEAIYLLHGSDSNLDKAEAKKRVQSWTGKQVFI